MQEEWGCNVHVRTVPRKVIKQTLKADESDIVDELMKFLCKEDGSDLDPEDRDILESAPTKDLQKCFKESLSFNGVVFSEGVEDAKN
jgi:hypothetical protein